VPRFAIAPLGLTTEGSTKFKPKGWQCYLKKLQNWKSTNGLTWVSCRSCPTTWGSYNWNTCWGSWQQWWRRPSARGPGTGSRGAPGWRRAGAAGRTPAPSTTGRRRCRRSRGPSPRRRSCRGPRGPRANLPPWRGSARRGAASWLGGPAFPAPSANPLRIPGWPGGRWP